MKQPWAASISSMLLVGVALRAPGIALEIATGSVHPNWSAAVSFPLFILACVVVRKHIGNWTNAVLIGGICMAAAISMVWREIAATPDLARHASAEIVLSLIIGVVLGITIHANAAALRVRQTVASSNR